MIRLGHTSFWLDVAPGGDAWILLRHTTGKKGKTEHLGRFASSRHVLQCKKRLGLPDEAVEDLRDLVDAMSAGDEAVGDVPSAAQ